MIRLDTLQDTARTRKSRKRVGRGLGSKLGKTCGRGQKGAKARSGYKRRYGKEGGNMPLFMKLPIRGFNNARFRTEYDTVNLDQIDAVFNDGEVVNIETLQAKGFISGRSKGLKILGNGTISPKKIKIQATAISESAREKLVQAKIPFEVVA
jgi:large subunit ribosomal protein L15